VSVTGIDGHVEQGHRLMDDERRAERDLPSRTDLEAIRCPGQVCRRAQMHWAMRHVDSLDDAEDLAGEICVHCIQGRSHFRGDAEFSTWLRRIAINVLRDHIRAKRARTADTEECNPDFGTPVILPESYRWPTAGLNATSLHDAMNRLTPRQRHLIEWKYGDQLTYREIAARLDTTPQAVSQALRRARLTLKQAMVEAPAAS
jgi:RNA polymerase sigma-70 factor (ECF subfamily)